RLLEWCLMPNHWHFVVYPQEDDQMTRFFRWLTHTHAMRAITHRRVMGMGPLYQGRFKTLPVEADEHLLMLLRYVQRNPVRAGMVKRVQQWKWGAEWVRSRGADKTGLAELAKVISPLPVDRPRGWLEWVNGPQTDAEVKALRECVRRSRPFGDVQWTEEISERLNLQWTQRPRGRPGKEK
ncbi:MAG: transposase, partial [Phycisphaerae bacterium]|nr:transposase [Phycisphaerae bacterium]